MKGVSRSADDAYVFHKENGQPHTDTTIRKWFYDLREAAGVAKEVQFADIRDGSFTEAVAGRASSSSTPRCWRGIGAASVTPTFVEHPGWLRRLVRPSSVPTSKRRFELRHPSSLSYIPIQ